MERYEQWSRAVERGEYTAVGPIEYGPGYRGAPDPSRVGPRAETAGMTTSLESLTVFLPQPAASQLATALAAVADAAETAWEAAVVSGNPGRSCRIDLAGTRIEIVEGQAPSAAPEQLAVTVPDPEAAIERLTALGFAVEAVEGDARVAGSVSVAGVRILILAD